MYRKGVSTLIVNKKNEFLLVNLESFASHYFAIPGGGLDENETLEQAAYREIKEELNIKKQDLELIGKSDNPLRITFKTIKLHRNGNEYKGSERHFFGFKYTGDEFTITPADGEVRSYIWSSYEDLRKYLLFDNQLDNTLIKIKEIFKI